MPDVFPPVSEEHAAAIGYVAIQWSAVEWAIVGLVGSLLGLSRPVTLAVIGDRAPVAALNVVAVLIRLSGDDLAISEWDALANRHETLRPPRNDAIHSEWRASGDQHFAMRSKSNRKLTISFRPISTAALDTLANDCLALAEDITAFSSRLLSRKVHEAILSYHPPGLNTRPPQPPARAPSPIPKPRSRRLSSAQKRKASSEGDQ